MRETTSSRGNSGGVGSARKKSYKAPELIEWGSIRDLTQGGKLGTEDLDFTGTGSG